MDRARSPRPVPTGTFPVIDVGVLLAVVGLLAAVAWLGHDTWHRLAPEALATMDLSRSRLPYYAVRSLLRMFVALGTSLAFTLLPHSHENSHLTLLDEKLVCRVRSRHYRRPRRLGWPRTPDFQSGNTGSNPLGDTTVRLLPSVPVAWRHCTASPCKSRP